MKSILKKIIFSVSFSKVFFLILYYLNINTFLFQKGRYRCIHALHQRGSFSRIYAFFQLHPVKYVKLDLCPFQNMSVFKWFLTLKVSQILLSSSVILTKHATTPTDEREGCDGFCLYEGEQNWGPRPTIRSCQSLPYYLNNHSNRLVKLNPKPTTQNKHYSLLSLQYHLQCVKIVSQ